MATGPSACNKEDPRAVANCKELMELFDLIEFEAYALESLSSRRRQGIVESNFALVVPSDFVF